MAKYTLLDTPGLGDLEMLLPAWAGKLNASSVKGRKVALVLMVFKAALRPTAQDKTNFLIMQEAIKEIQPENICHVMTFVDENPKRYTIEKEMEFLEQLYKFLPGQVAPKQENVFLFKGEGDSSLPETTPEELDQWLASIIPAKLAKVTDEFSYENYIQKVEGTGDPVLIKMLKDELE
jgi:hypothetical protein